MKKAALGVAFLWIPIFFSGIDLFAQSVKDEAKGNSSFLVPIKSKPTQILPINHGHDELPIKTCDFKTIRDQYSRILSVKPDSEMIQPTREKQLLAEREEALKEQTKQNQIMRASLAISNQFNLAQLTWSDLQLATPDLVSMEETASLDKAEVVNDEKNISSNDALILNPTLTTVAYRQEVSDEPGNKEILPMNIAVSIRRTSGVLHGKSKLEQNYILSYKIHENEGE